MKPNTKAPHTPGPGVATFDHATNRTVVQKSEFGPSPLIMETPENGLSLDEIAANARLIKAAPELLRDLSEMMELAQAIVNNWEKGDLAQAVIDLEWYTVKKVAETLDAATN